MANYDYKSAKRYIQMHSDLIESAALGIREDWFWTAEDIYKNDKFEVDLDDESLKIAGISGSYWGTPILEVRFKSGEEKTKPCYVGDDPTGQKPDWFELGCLSQPVQDFREGKYIEVSSGEEQCPD